MTTKHSIQDTPATPLPWMHVVVGQQVHAALHAEKERTVPHSKRPGMEQYFESESLCRWQSECYRRGVRGVELVKSIYGFSVRYDSGLADFGLLAGARDGQLDGSFEDAVRFATEWVNEDPAHRYAWTRDDAARALLRELGESE
jgi:hypothetical protein